MISAKRYEKALRAATKWEKDDIHRTPKMLNALSALGTTRYNVRKRGGYMRVWGLRTCEYVFRVE